MLTSLEIANYRGFKTYQMDGLAQVNLLVGKNNSGKTAIAEAIHLITSGGDPVILAEIAQRRGEVSAVEENGRALPDLTHFFHGHVFSPDSSFSICSDNGYPPLTVRLIPIPTEPGLFSDEDEDFGARPAYGVVIEGAAGFGGGEKDLGLSDRGALIFSQRARIRQVSSQLPPSRPTLFVSTDPIPPRRLSMLWRQAILDDIQQDVVSAMQLIEPSIQSLVVLPPDGASRNISSSRDWYIQTKDYSRPVPLGSYGDGVRRLMTLALALARVRNGTLLVDEIDTGLHYSVMAEMWELVIKKSLASRVQVFATTHSWDCIEGLSNLCKREPQLAPSVAIHKIDRVIPRSVQFAGTSIVQMVKSDIDPR